MLNSSVKLNRSVSALLVALVLALAAFPVVASAQSVTPESAVSSEECGSPTNSQYKDATGQITTCVKADTGGGGSLPFTGFDVVAMAAVALAVTGLGLALQRAVSRHSAS